MMTKGFIHERIRMILLSVFMIMICVGVFAQSQPFPYSISVTSVRGNCYDDCRIIIAMYDEAGNEVVVNPQTHNAQNITAYPLYNIQYHYRNVSGGTNTQYDTVNDIRVVAGTYCIGITGYVPVTLPGGQTDYVMVDTTVCNLEVMANYDHLEASVLSSMSRNNYETWDDSGREFCGWRPSYDCFDRGRIQLKLMKGKFPYRVLIFDAFQDTVRQATFWQRQQSGIDSVFADYQDYYTFDSMPVGNYNIKVSDSCDYTLWLSIEIPSADPYNIARVAYNDPYCKDSTILTFYYRRDCNLQLHDYDGPYFDSILQYRFINPSGDTTEWYPHVNNQWDPNYNYLQDTLKHISSYCEVYNDTVWFQIRDLCHDTIYSSRFFYTRDYQFQDEVSPASMNMVTTSDTCGVHALSGLTSQTYDFFGRIWCWGCNYENYDLNWPTEIPSQLYFCPLSYDVYSSVDSTLIVHNESDSYDRFSAPITFFADTVIPVHMEVRDAKGCLLVARDEVLTFDVEDAGDSPYPYTMHSMLDDWGWNGCCGYDRYLYLKQEIDAVSYRQNMIVHLVESPLYNRFNFTAVCQNGTWSYTADDPANHHTYAECWSDGGAWQVTVRDSVCLAPGRYTFVVTSSCGNDTVSYVFWDTFYKDSIALDVEPQYSMQQICDRLTVQQTSVVLNTYSLYIDPTVDNNEASVNIYPASYYVHVVDGVPGGYNEWPDGNGNFVFTVPGSYIIETYAWTSCYWLSHLDTVEYVPIYIDMDQGYAILCDNLSSTGFVYAHAINGTEPYTYYLYDQPDMMGTLVGTDTSGRFQNVPMTVGSQYSVLAEDACHNSFYINLTATPINQSALAWEFGDDVGHGHCEGDSVFLTALPFSFDVAYQWTGPNGFSSNERVNHVYLPYGSESGYYTLEILNTGCSTSVKDSVYIAVIQAPRVTILSDTMVCAGDGVTLGFQVQGSGVVNFDIMHSGAPATGVDSYSANSGSTVYQYYPIESDNIFWADHISDERCAYHHIVDTVHVVLFNPATSTTTPITTVDGYACYDHTASLKAFSSIATPYYINWYDDDRQTTLLQCDTISNAANYAVLYVNHVMGDTSVFVTVSNASNCQAAYGTLYHVVKMQNGITTLMRGEGARLYDSGGELGNYGDNEDMTYRFSCPGETQLDVVINSVDIAIGDTLYIYSGMAALSGSLLAALTHTSSVGNLTVHQSAVTFRFKSNWVNNRGGWSIDIYTGVPMVEVMAHVSPLNYDTVAAVVCASPTPYETPYFPPLDISQSREYLTDTLITSGDGCQTIVHLHLVVNPVSQTEVQDFLMPCQLPYTWNGVTFTDYGTQTAVLTNEFGCDSMVIMTLLWAPPVDSTTIYDTIVENQLPYLINGITFTGPGMQQVTLVNQQGCDSVVTMYLHVFYNVFAEADSVICDSELPLIWNGVTFTQTDTQTVTLTAHTGADSVLTMRLWVNPTHQTVFVDTTCQHTEYNNYGFVLSEHETSASGINTFTRTLSNQFVCDSVILLNLLVVPDITPDFYAIPDKAMLSENAEIQFINHTDVSSLAQMNYFWVWDFGDGSYDTTYVPNTEHLYTQWGDYTVTLTLMVNGCESSYSILVIIEADLKFPNVITPNGDGVNDVFIIKDLNPERSNTLQIVDRWGKLVFKQTNYQTYMKDEYVYNVDSGFGMGDVPDGVYYYTFYYEGLVRTIQFNGTITVIKDRK